MEHTAGNANLNVKPKQDALFATAEWALAVINIVTIAGNDPYFHSTHEIKFSFTSILDNSRSLRGLKKIITSEFHRKSTWHT